MSILDLQAEFGTDQQLEEEGVWVYPVVRNSKIGFLLRRMATSNREWTNRASVNYRKHKRKIEQGHVTDPKLLEDSYRTFCSTVLIRWCGLDDKDGQPIEYAVEKGVKLFQKYPDLYQRLSDDAQEISTFQREEIEEIAGKSQDT